MSNQQPLKAQSSLTNPQVIAAIIGGVVTLAAAILGVLPNIINRPPQATAVIVVTATPLPATPLELTATPLPPTDVPPSAEIVAVVPSATVVPPTATPIPPTVIPATPILPTSVPPPTILAQPANALFIWDDVSFTAINTGGSRLSLVGVTFSSGRGFWDARDWGPSLYNSVPPRDCLRLRDSTAGQRNPPAECADLYGLILIGTSAIFWRSADSFDVLRNGRVIATCPVSAERCEVYIG
jgi:hypothetical protein